MNVFQLLDHKDIIGYYSSIEKAKVAALAYYKQHYKDLGYKSSFDNDSSTTWIVCSDGFIPTRLYNNLDISDYKDEPTKSLADQDPKIKFTINQSVTFTLIKIKVDDYFDICCNRFEIKQT